MSARVGELGLRGEHSVLDRPSVQIDPGGGDSADPLVLPADAADVGGDRVDREADGSSDRVRFDPGGVEREHLLLEVRDSGTGVPSIQRSLPDEVSGRGLLIVSRLAERWGIRPGPAGKTVWAQFRLSVTDSDELAV